MHRRLIFAAFAAAALTSGCTRPTHEHATLAAIKVESRALMQAHPAKMDLPKGDWPRGIASLQPTFVRVDEQGVDIMVHPAMDDGYGYYVPKARELPGPRDMYSKLEEGIYWYHPY